MFFGRQKALVKATFAACALVTSSVWGVSRIDYPDADTVVIDDRTRIEYSADGSYIAENDESIQALTEKGAAPCVQLRLAFPEDTEMPKL